MQNILITHRRVIRNKDRTSLLSTLTQMGSIPQNLKPKILQITTLAEPGGSDDLTSAATRLIYSRSCLESLTTSTPVQKKKKKKKNPQKIPAFACWAFGPTIYTWADAALELLLVLSATDKGGQREIWTWRLHKQSPSCYLDCTNNSQIPEQGKTNSNHMFHKYWLKSRDRDQIYLERSDLKEGRKLCQDPRDDWSVSGAGGTFLAFLWCVSCASEWAVNELQSWQVRNSPGPQDTRERWERFQNCSVCWSLLSTSIVCLNIKNEELHNNPNPCTMSAVRKQIRNNQQNSSFFIK